MDFFTRQKRKKKAPMRSKEKCYRPPDIRGEREVSRKREGEYPKETPERGLYHLKKKG